MKVPKFISEVEYERRLNSLTKKLEERLEQIRTRGSNRENSKMDRLYTAFFTADQPLTSREAAMKSGAFGAFGPKEQRLYRVAVERLQQEGWLIPVDKVERTWKLRGQGVMHQMVMRFKAVENNSENRIRRMEAAIRICLSKVDTLDAMRVHGVCVASVVKNYPHTLDLRRERIFKMRMEQVPLQRIGDMYGVSKERIRQIIERTIKQNGVEE